MGFIEIKNLKKRYMVTRTESQEILKGINVSFSRGEFVALLGESGCGKSTFLNILSGLDFDYTGSIIINTEFIRDFSERELDHYRKNKVGIIFQSFNLIKQMTVFENVMLPLTLTKLTVEERKARASELLEEVGLTEHKDKYPNQLSGGQKQRVAVARALANNPFVLLADEPTGNLDANSAAEITELLKKIAQQGRLVIVVTHSEKMASHCTRVIKLEDGIISSDTAQRQKKEREQLIRPTQIKDNIDKKEIFSFAKNNILNKASFKRNLLVSIALGIGICAFVLMLFLGAGLKQYVETEMDTGSNKLQINVQKNTLGTFTSTETNYFKNGIIDGVAGVYEATAVSDLKLTYKAGTAVNNILYGASIYDGFQMKLQYGNLPNNSISAEILISSAMARRLLTDENLEISTVIGQSAVLTYNGGSDKTFTICGIFEDDTYDTVYVSKGGLSFTNLGTNLLYVIGTDVAHINAIIDDIGYLITNAVVTRMDTKAEDILGYIDMGSMMLSVVSLIALVVSAIMIFIVMYISVVERTKEIGILRALGVRRKDVKRIFITEAGIIGIVAGFMGCIAALILGLVVPIMSVNVWYLLLGLGISFVLSVVSSFGPSGSASSLDPIEALRTE